jgi:Dyp-type peroxidase family
VAAMIGLDLADIQGNIHRAYGRYGFPHGRHFFFNISAAAGARRFVQAMRPRVTTAEPWTKSQTVEGKAVITKPPIALNIGFTFRGLLALKLPTRTLQCFPEEFIEGMECRAPILGDVLDSDPKCWDPFWRDALKDSRTEVHIWVSFSAAMNADGTPVDALAEWTKWLNDLAVDGVTLLGGHGGDPTRYWQDSRAIMAELSGGLIAPQPQEHFRYRDGISDPTFRGQFDAEDPAAVIGAGKIAAGNYDEAKSWSPLEAGEFILGQVDEGQELPVATRPASFARNGSFMVWRKLRQNVDVFNAEMRRQADLWKAATGVSDDEEAFETVCAKLVGRWRSGISLMTAPTYAEHRHMTEAWKDCLAPAPQVSDERWAAFTKMLMAFRYGDDLDGSVCPFGAHIRRANPRDMLDPLLSAKQGASTLTNRRRILRRGLPYFDPHDEVGIIFMGVCSSLFRQFEFMQQQWMNYGLDFEAGNDSCPLIGSRSQSDKHVIPAGKANSATFIAAGLPEFVNTRGGDYFFLPSLSAIRMIAMGTVDPT